MWDCFKTNWKKALGESLPMSILLIFGLLFSTFVIFSDYLPQISAVIFSIVTTFLLIGLVIVIVSYINYRFEVYTKNMQREKDAASQEAWQKLLYSIFHCEINGLISTTSVSETNILALEEGLGILLPKSYKMFLFILGNLEYQAPLIYGDCRKTVLDENWLEKTTVLREANVIPSTFLLLNLNYYMDTSKSDPLTGEYEIILWDGIRGKNSYHNFPDFLKDIVDQHIKTMYELTVKSL